MGLNESYDAIRSQILVMDTLPSLNKAYSMVLRVEKQRSVQVDLIAGTGNTDSSAMLVNLRISGKEQMAYEIRRKMIMSCVSIANSLDILKTLASKFMDIQSGISC